MYISYQNERIVGYTEQAQDLVLYNLDKVEYTDKEYVYDVDVQEYVLKDEAWEEKELQRVKKAKIEENDTIRDNTINAGVKYKDVLFDSDTDQKMNLIAIVSTIDEKDVITWFGKDNIPLECTKDDLINIGGLITVLHTFCWSKNAQIKALINDAETIQEVEEIVIDYTMPEVEPEPTED